MVFELTSVVKSFSYIFGLFVIFSHIDYYIVLMNFKEVYYYHYQRTFTFPMLNNMQTTKP